MTEEHKRPHEHGHGDRHNHDHKHDHVYKTHFHDPQHAAEFDRRTSDIRSDFAEKLADLLALKGDEQILDLATGTGRMARPVVKRLKTGRIVGVDQAIAMLDVGHHHEDAIPAYSQSAGDADALPFKAGVFDCAFVSFSLHHFGNPAGVVGEVLRVLKNGGRFVVLDPIIKESQDAVDVALETKINQIFRRTHGEDFRFHTANSIQRLLLKSGYRIARASVVTHPFDQDGVDGIPTGRHWLEVGEELELEAPQLAQRLRENYFSWHKHGDVVHVKGSFSYALICAERPA